MDIFAPGSRNPQCFTVINISPEPKTIRIFNYPINHGCTRDLLAIPGVAEGDIRASLLKGELRYKILAGVIAIICSDIDLLQFNGIQSAFLQNAGVTNGLQIGYDQLDGYVQSLFGGGSGGITPMEHETLRQLIHFIEIGGPGDGFATGAVRITAPSGSPFPTDITWYLDNTLSTKLVEKIIVYNDNNVPTTITYNMFDFDGITIIHTVIDTITYINNIFEYMRVRSII
jgi:hypothetical protein